MTTTKKIATGFAAGVLIGTTLGILFAPKKGAKTRTLIAEKAKEMAKAASDTYSNAKSKLGLSEEVRDHIAV